MKLSTTPASTAQEPQAQASWKADLRSIIDQHLTAAYACTRVWEAWQVGTMTEDDFMPLRETELVEELACAIESALALSAQPERVGATSFELGAEFLAAGKALRDICIGEGLGSSAVCWVIGDDGSMSIYTRGEYSDRLLALINSLPNRAAT